MPGCTFSLTGHPRERANIEYITLETRFVIENVGEDTQRAVQVGSATMVAGGATAVTGLTGVDGLAALSDAQRLSGQWRVAVEFDVQPTTEALRPETIQPKPKTGGPETARVVGPDASTAETNIYTDALGRIKIEFPWDRHGQKNQNSSCWVRVANAWAGNQFGAMQVPRVGQEVVVDFLGGERPRSQASAVRRPHPRRTNRHSKPDRRTRSTVA